MTIMISHEDMVDVAVAVANALEWARRKLGPILSLLSTAFISDGGCQWRNHMLEELYMH